MVYCKRYFYVICGSLLTLAACGSKTLPSATQVSAQTTIQKPVMDSEKHTGKGAVSLPGQGGTPERIAPGNCRLVGEIISVLPELEPDKTTPCGQVPCRAIVKVQQILGYGSAFGKPLAKNQEINVYFVFTLSSTKQYFPELTTTLPGLKAGDIFIADVKRGQDEGGNNMPWFQVYGYKVKK